MSALTTALGVAGCNIFNPTEDVNIKSDDAAALCYEGYLHYQKNEYSTAREYFEKAIAADSNYSEAWYGRAKATLNMQPGLNIFELLSYAKADGTNAMSKFATMDPETARILGKGIDSVFYYIDPFIERERQGKTDGRVKFNHFSGSYTILKMAKSGLLLRGTALDITTLLHFEGNNINVDINGILALGENVTEVLDVAEDLVEALKENPDQAYNLLNSVYPEAMENFTPTAVENALGATLGGVSYVNNNLKASGIGRSSIHSTNTGFDDDADGCVDEEVMDGFDNDGDGDIDEDIRIDATTEMFNEDALYNYYLEDDPSGLETISYFVGHPFDKISSVKPVIETANVDVDGDGIPSAVDEKEWSFVYPEHRDRKNTGDHRFVFALNLNWVPAPENKDYYYYKELLRKDPLNPDYNLAWRKEHIGGCWNNYSSEGDPSYIEWINSHIIKMSEAAY